MGERFDNGNPVIGHDCRCEYCGRGMDETPEAEADRRLGAKVRGAIMAGDAAVYGLDALESMAADCDTRTRWATPGEVLRTIADALREEADR